MHHRRRPCFGLLRAGERTHAYWLGAAGRGGKGLCAIGCNQGKELPLVAVHTWWNCKYRSKAHLCFVSWSFQVIFPGVWRGMSLYCCCILLTDSSRVFFWGCPGRWNSMVLRGGTFHWCNLWVADVLLFCGWNRPEAAKSPPCDSPFLDAVIGISPLKGDDHPTPHFIVFSCWVKPRCTVIASALEHP